MHGLSFYLFTISEYPFWYLQTFLRQQMELFAALSNLHCNKKRQFIWYCKINISKNVHNEEYKLLININLKTNVALHYDNMKYHKDTIKQQKENCGMMKQSDKNTTWRLWLYFWMGYHVTRNNLILRIQCPLKNCNKNKGVTYIMLTE
jgi:hypothetical protein